MTEMVERVATAAEPREIIAEVIGPDSAGSVLNLMAADMILTALKAAGFAVVPVEATAGMCEAGSAIDEQPYDLPALAGGKGEG